ncbi:hypothetical protein [Streptomyces sp. NPDC056670]|uniref:hypothetical protein n=1 Tax=unclassified Streptomyces TaxID=2593676 RepID=UPI00369CFE15
MVGTRTRGPHPSVRGGPLRARARRAGWAARCVRRVYAAGRLTGRWQERLRRSRR